MTTLSTTDLDMDLIKRTIAVGASNDELALFAAQCRRTGLDPFARQINFVLRKSKAANGDWIQKATIMISIDGARLMAARTGLYNGSDTVWCGDDGVWTDVWLTSSPPAAAKVSVSRGNGQFSGIALWREYGAPAFGPVWKNMPAHMLAKCAEMLALRKAFPAELSGLYSSDEMAQADTQVVETVQVPVPMIALNKRTSPLASVTSLLTTSTLPTCLPQYAKIKATPHGIGQKMMTQMRGNMSGSQPRHTPARSKSQCRWWSWKN